MSIWWWPRMWRTNYTTFVIRQSSLVVIRGPRITTPPCQTLCQHGQGNLDRDECSADVCQYGEYLGHEILQIAIATVAMRAIKRDTSSAGWEKWPFKWHKQGEMKWSRFGVANEMSSQSELWHTGKANNLEGKQLAEPKRYTRSCLISDNYNNKTSFAMIDDFVGVGKTCFRAAWVEIVKWK